MVKKFIILLLVMGWTIHASPVLITSPQSQATAGQFGSDADNLLSTRYYNYIDFNQFFSVVSYTAGVTGETFPAGRYSPAEAAKLGVAARFGDLYTALYYGGNAWEYLGFMSPGRSMFDYTVQDINGKTMKIYQGLPFLNENNVPRNYNETALLIGIADMGFRLSYVHTLQSVKLNEDFATGIGSHYEFYEYYKNSRFELGHINPGIAWGMARDLIPGKGIRPELKVDLDFFRNVMESEMYKKDYNTFPAEVLRETKGREIFRSQNTFSLGINAAAGGFTLRQKDGFRLGTDLEYGFNFSTPLGNEYSYPVAEDEFGEGTYRTKKLDPGYDFRTSGNVFNKINKTTHTVTPSMGVSWEGDNIKLSSRFGLGITIAEEKKEELTFRAGNIMETSGDGKYVKNNKSTDLSSFSFEPTLDLGMQWTIIPDTLFLNAGSKISFGNPYWVTEETKDYALGTLKKSSEKNIRNTEATTVSQTDGAKTVLSLGLTFRLYEHVEFQAVCGVISGQNNVNMFKFDAGDGFFNFANILLSVRF
ncbi:MAG: hypothetical protein FWD36_06710 [Treponema sp.]|nr:hypothetical protein [Treponema sp.]